jgi:hypothetical protein
METSSLRKIARLVVPLLLLLSVVPLFFAQNVMSQQFRTLTSYTTTTATGSSLEYYSQATTSARTTGFTQSFTLTARLSSGQSSCLVGIIRFPFNITSSQTVHVDYSSSLSTDFALFNAPTFAAWAMQPQCYFWMGFSKSSITRGTFDIPLDPGSGQVVKLNNPYWLIFLHRGPGIFPKITVAVNGVLLQEPTFLTLTSTHMLTRTRTLTSYETQEIPFLEANGSWLMPLAIVIIVAVMLLVTWRIKRV